jgi:hypothetical protein
LGADLVEPLDRTMGGLVERERAGVQMRQGWV